MLQLKNLQNSLHFPKELFLYLNLILQIWGHEGMTIAKDLCCNAKHFESEIHVNDVMQSSSPDPSLPGPGTARPPARRPLPR